MKLCVQWPTFGPYHIARLKALAKISANAHWEVAGLETAASDITGRAREELEDTLLPATVFEGKRLLDLTPRSVDSAVRKALDQIQPDVVAINSYSFPDARACLTWCLDHSRGTILMSDSRREDAPRVWWREWIKGTIVSQFGAAVVAGAPQRRYVRELGLTDGQIFEGYDVVDNDFFAENAVRARADSGRTRTLPGLADSTRFFLASGRMIERKDYPTLIGAYQSYRSMSENPWRLVVLGDGELRTRIEELIAREGIDGITLAGWQPYETLPAYYGQADAFVHSASVDQWGLVVNEAMASGLPVIVSEGTGCVEDLVNGKGSGLTFQPGDVDRLAELMLKMSSDATARAVMAKKAREVIAAWSPDRFAESMQEASEVALSHAATGSTVARLVLRTIRAASRKLTSFHSVEA